MSLNEQNKILDAKIESNVNQYKVDRMNAEISAFSSGDLNKYEFLKRIDLNYKSNALDKARFEFSPLGKTFSIGLDKTAQGYQEEGVIKLLKDIIDGLANGGNMNWIIDLTMNLIIGMTIDLVINLMIVHLMVQMMMVQMTMVRILIKNIVVCFLNIFN